MEPTRHKQNFLLAILASFIMVMIETPSFLTGLIYPIIFFTALDEIKERILQ